MSEIVKASITPFTFVVAKTFRAPTVVNLPSSCRNDTEEVLGLICSEVVLNQNPKERFGVKILIETKDKYSVDTHEYLYKVIAWLSFTNHIYGFNENYAYEILCERVQSKTQLTERLFTFFKMRYDDSFNICDNKTQVFKTSEYIEENESLFFYIRRHNLKYFIKEVNQCINYNWLYKEVLPNVKLYVNGESILVHKFLLTHKSEVFKAMFSTDMTESETGIVRIDDFSADVIKEMVNFMYTNQTENILKMRYKLYKAAHKYQLQDLCIACIEHILFNLNFENIAETLDLAHIYDIKELIDSALSFVKSHPKKISKEPSFQDYMCRTMAVENVIDRLLFAIKYTIEKVKEKALDFIGQRFCEMIENCKFNELFQSHPHLMKEIVHHYCQNYAGKN